MQATHLEQLFISSAPHQLMHSTRLGALTNLTALGLRGGLEALPENLSALQQLQVLDLQSELQSLHLVMTLHFSCLVHIAQSPSLAGLAQPQYHQHGVLGGLTCLGLNASQLGAVAYVQATPSVPAAVLSRNQTCFQA